MKKQRLMVLAAFSCLVIIATLIGCGTAGIDGFLIPVGNSLAPKFAFVVNGNSDDSGVSTTINVYTVNPTTGALTRVVTDFDPGIGANCCSGQATVFIDADPTSRFLYVPLPTQGKIAVFSVNQTTGALTAVSGSPFTSTAANPYSAKLNPAGTVLYVTNYSDNTISTFAVDTTTGKLTQVGSDLPLSSWPHLVLMDPQGRFLYVPNEAGEFDGFKISSSNGSLTAIPGGPFAADNYSTGGTLDATGQFLLVANKYACNPGTISVYKIDPTTGVPTEAAGSPFTTITGSGNCGPYTVAEFIVGGQAFVAANNYNNTSNISVFSLNTSTGALTAVSGSPFVFNGWQWAHYITADTSGQFGYVVDFGCSGFCQGASTITGLTVNSSGALTQIPGSPFANGTDSPTQIVFSH